MNMRFTEILHKFENRRTGKTTAVAEWAKKMNGVVVCFSHEDAKRVQREFGVEAISVYETEKARWLRKPVIFDSTATEEIERHYVGKIIHLEKEIRGLIEDNRVLKNENYFSDREIETLKNELVESRVNALGLTRGFDKHPEWYDGECECTKCLSYK